MSLQNKKGNSNSTAVQLDRKYQAATRASSIPLKIKSFIFEEKSSSRWKIKESERAVLKKI
jgi:hypothetical protein